MDRFMLHLKNSDYTPKDAKTIRSNSRDLAYGMSVIIRDCRISSKFIELDVSVHKNNLELLLEKLASIGQIDDSRHIIEEEIEKNQLIKDGIFYFNEIFDVHKLIGFIFIWIAVIVYLIDLNQSK